MHQTLRNNNSVKRRSPSSSSSSLHQPSSKKHSSDTRNLTCDGFSSIPLPSNEVDEETPPESDSMMYTWMRQQMQKVQKVCYNILEKEKKVEVTSETSQRCLNTFKKMKKVCDEAVESKEEHEKEQEHEPSPDAKDEKEQEEKHYLDSFVAEDEKVISQFDPLGKLLNNGETEKLKAYFDALDKEDLVEEYSSSLEKPTTWVGGLKN